MKINKFIFLSVAICCATAALWTEIQGMEDQKEKQKTYWNIKSSLDEHLRINSSLLHSSKDKDIVVVLGATGSGKSTLINYLMGLELMPNDNEEIELVDPTNPLSMKIGHTRESTTFLPKCASVGSIFFYDLPGFRDTRGICDNLLGGSFIKYIIENARSTRLIFVAGQDEITAGKGESFNGLVEVSRVLFPENMDVIHKSSLLVITKSIKNTPETLMEYLKDRVDMEKLELWKNTNRIFPMPKKNLDPNQKGIIVNKVNEIPGFKINKVNIESVYSSNLKIHIKDIIALEMEQFMKQVLGQASKDHQTINSINQAKIYFSGCFENDVLQKINTSPLLTLFKPLSEFIYESERQEILRLIAQGRELELAKLDVKKAGIEKAEWEAQILKEKAEQDEIIRKQQEQIRLTAIEQQKMQQKIEESEKRAKLIENHNLEAWSAYGMTGWLPQTVGIGMATFSDKLYLAATNSCEPYIAFSSDPSNPQSWSAYKVPGWLPQTVGIGMATFGDKLYLAATNSCEPYIAFSSDPSNPQAWSAYGMTGWLPQTVGVGMASFGGKLYLAATNSCEPYIAFSSDPSNPQAWSAYGVPGWMPQTVGVGMASFGGRLYLAATNSCEPYIAFSSDPSNPQAWSAYKVPGWLPQTVGVGMASFGGKLYLAATNSCEPYIAFSSDPSNPQAWSAYGVPGWMPQTVGVGMASFGDQLYLAATNSYEPYIGYLLKK